MLSTHALVLIALFNILPAYAQEVVSLAQGRVNFVPPTGFRAWTPEQIKIKYPAAKAPGYVSANDAGNVSIALTFSNQALRPDQLPELKAAMEKTLPRLIPGHRWIKQEIVEINGTPWVHFEFTSFAIDTDIHNDMYMTAFDGKMLGFNFNSTAGQYEKYRDALAKSRDSIRISQK